MPNVDSSHSEYSDTGFQNSTGSSEDSDMEVDNSKQDRSSQEVCKKRKYIKQTFSDSSPEDDASSVVRALKKRRKRSPKKLPDDNEQRKTLDVSSGAETEEINQTPVKGYRLHSDESDSEENLTSPDMLKSTERHEMESDVTESEKIKEKNIQEEDASDSSLLENSVAEELHNEQQCLEKTRQSSWSGSSDISLDNNEKNKSVSQKESDGSDSAESFTSPDVHEPVQKGKIKSGRNKTEHKVKKDSESAKKSDRGIERLKKYLRVAGLRVRSYDKLWEGCKTKKARTEKLLQMLNDAGLKGKPTLQKCKRLQAKRERKEEVASLDVGNIITSDRGRPKRNAWSLYLNPYTKTTAVGEKPQEDKNTNTFSRIKSFIDSEESD